MDDWEELDLDANNVEYLSKVNIQSNPKFPDRKEKEKIKEEKNEMEKEIISEKQSQADSLYSYDQSKVNSFSNRIAKSLNYLDLVAKILPNPDKPEKILQFLHISSTIKKNVGGCVHVTYR